MRKLQQILLGSLLVGLPALMIACGDEEDPGDGNNGGASSTGGNSNGTGSSSNDGGSTGTPPNPEVPFTLDDCNATSGPNDAVKNSEVGAFAENADWMDGWTNWSSSANKSGLVVPTEQVTLEGELSGDDLNWTKDKAYVLNGYVWVPDGSTLTIEAGTVILGQINSTTSQAGTLFIARGAKIDAVGTKEEPIVFTSKKANGSKAAGDWGGVVLLGKAHVRQDELTYEGLSGDTYPWAVFGGGGTETDVNDDDSGEMKYVRIEFGGAILQSNKEINGLSLGGVGSATKLSYIQVNANRDDCFEFFGGRVSADHLVCNNGGDDQIDTDDSYQGTISYAFARGTINSSSDPNGLEWDGVTDIVVGDPPVRDEFVDTIVNLEHATLCGADGLFGVASYGAMLRRGIKGSLDDVFFVGWDATIDTRDAFTADSMTITNSASSQAFDGPGYPEEGVCAEGDPVTCDDDAAFDEAAWFEAGEGNKNWDE